MMSSQEVMTSQPKTYKRAAYLASSGEEFKLSYSKQFWDPQVFVIYDINYG